ncbi:MAG: hypothetical protein WC314_22625 [Vulcanimicrobiota bacterium]
MALLPLMLLQFFAPPVVLFRVCRVNFRLARQGGHQTLKEAGCSDQEILHGTAWWACRETFRVLLVPTLVLAVGGTAMECLDLTVFLPAALSMPVYALVLTYPAQCLALAMARTDLFSRPEFWWRCLSAACPWLLLGYFWSSLDLLLPRSDLFPLVLFGWLFLVGWSLWRLSAYCLSARRTPL